MGSSGTDSNESSQTLEEMSREELVDALLLAQAELTRAQSVAETERARCAAMAVDNARLYRSAQDAIAAREDLLSIVSHELKNPLTAITLSADVMIKGAPNDDRRKSRRNLDRVKRGVSHMRDMIEDLQDLSSLESGHLSIEPRPAELREIVDDAIDLMLPLAHDKHIEVEQAPGPLQGALCDRNRVVQVLSNLLDNAVRFTPENGRITVAIHALPENRLRVDVHDEGPGIPPQVVPHIFERYWQTKETASKGRGLGLYIAKGIVETMGGTLWVETHATRGTTFSFTLTAVELPGSKKLNHPAGVVMVVDDDDDIRELITDILEDNAYQVVQASNGKRALDYLKSGKPAPSMMLVDLTMPVMDGRELVRALKKDATLAAIPVVLVSSVVNLGDEAAALGAQGTLRKPLDIDGLLSVVSQQAAATAT